MKAKRTRCKTSWKFTVRCRWTSSREDKILSPRIFLRVCQGPLLGVLARANLGSQVMALACSGVPGGGTRLLWCPRWWHPVVLVSQVVALAYSGVPGSGTRLFCCPRWWHPLVLASQVMAPATVVSHALVSLLSCVPGRMGSQVMFPPCFLLLLVSGDGAFSLEVTGMGTRESGANGVAAHWFRQR